MEIPGLPNNITGNLNNWIAHSVHSHVAYSVTDICVMLLQNLVFAYAKEEGSEQLGYCVGISASLLSR